MLGILVGLITVVSTVLNTRHNVTLSEVQLSPQRSMQCDYMPVNMHRTNRKQVVLVRSGA